MSGKRQGASIDDVHAIARSMPHVAALVDGPKVVYQVGGRSFIFFRNPRSDAIDETTGEKLNDVIVIWVPSEADKQALVQDRSLPFFTTPHFDGHSSVLVRGSQLEKLTIDELSEVIEDAWLSRASAKRARDWLSRRALTGGSMQ